MHLIIIVQNNLFENFIRVNKRRRNVRIPFYSALFVGVALIAPANSQEQQLADCESYQISAAFIKAGNSTHNCSIDGNILTICRSESAYLQYSVVRDSQYCVAGPIESKDRTKIEFTGGWLKNWRVWDQDDDTIIVNFERDRRYSSGDPYCLRDVSPPYEVEIKWRRTAHPESHDVAALMESCWLREGAE